jgi:hypothetical protein
MKLIRRNNPRSDDKHYHYRIELNNGEIKEIRGFGTLSLVRKGSSYDLLNYSLIASDIRCIIDLWPDNKPR